MRQYMKSAIVVVIAGLLPHVLVAQDAKTQKAAEQSASGTYKVDAVHSSNVFRIKHLGVAYFYGRFNEVAGRFVIDEAQVANCSFEVSTKTASVDTNNADRDKHLRSPDYFDAEKYPEITFKSTSVKAAGGAVLDVTGDLSLHGVTKPVSVKLERTGAGPGMRGEFRCGFEATFTIQCSDFGMKTTPGLSDEVRFTISVEGIKQ